MSLFTVVIIIWVIYQLGISLLKKGNQQPARKFSDPLKLPDGRSIREAWQETSQGSWREQMQQALKNTSRQVEEWTVHSEPLQRDEAKDSIMDNTLTEGLGIKGTQGNGITQGSKKTNADEGMPDIGIGVEENPGETMPRGAQALCSPDFSMTNTELVQGIIWSEILGKPRALRPFRGPLS